MSSFQCAGSITRGLRTGISSTFDHSLPGESMSTIKPIFWMLVLAVSAIPPAMAESGLDLSQYRWKHRPLFIFAPANTDADFLALDRQLIKAAPELEDRDMIIFRIHENSPSHAAGKPLTREDANYLRRRFDAAPGRLTVVLVGKDGGVKLVAHRHVELQAIFSLVDSMPMRQQEMRDK
jgi:hypothetical protein